MTEQTPRSNNDFPGGYRIVHHLLGSQGAARMGKVVGSWLVTKTIVNSSAKDYGVGSVNLFYVTFQSVTLPLHGE